MSALQLVETANSMGHQWSAVVGVRADSGLGLPTEETPVAFREVPVVGSNPFRRYIEAIRILRTSPEVLRADVVLSFIPFSDMILSATRKKGTWIPFVRGLPWPDKTETSWARRTFWKTLETIALRSALEVWTTTDVLMKQIADVTPARVIPAGIKLPTPNPDFQVAPNGSVVWAGRMSIDKNPILFLEIMSSVATRGTMYGTGRMEKELQARASSNVEIGGWVPSTELWQNATVFVGTSSREAFGRSAVEAAASGIPVVIGSEYGAANLLYTDPELRRRFVLPIHDSAPWIAAVTSLLADNELRARVVEHIRHNANALTIENSAQKIQARLEIIVAR